MSWKMRGRRIVVGVAVMATCLAAGVTSAQPARTPIKVGAMIPITGSGATVGESGQIAVELAVRNINAAGGIAGRPVQLVIGDYQTEATVGVSEAKRLVFQEKIELLVGPTYSQVTLAVLPLLNEAKIPSVNVSGSERLTPEVGPYAFSMLANAEAQSKVMVDHAVRAMKVQSAAIMSDSGAQAKTAVEAIKAELAARNIKVAGVQEYQYRQADMTPQLLALRRGSPDVILLFTSNGEDTGNMIKSLNELGWGVKVVGSFGATFSGPALKIAGKDAYKNTVAVNYKGFSYCPSEPTSKVVYRFRRAGEGVQAGGLRPPAAVVPVALVRRGLCVEGSGRGVRGQDRRSQCRRVARNQFKVVSRHQQRAHGEQVHALPDRAGRLDDRLSGSPARGWDARARGLLRFSPRPNVSGPAGAGVSLARLFPCAACRDRADVRDALALTRSGKWPTDG